jgi:hypothetical protein
VQVRRERISDRLKALQLLIPNGDKVGPLKKRVQEQGSLPICEQMNLWKVCAEHLATV